MTTYDDQYDAPLSGRERVRIHAVEWALRRPPIVGAPAKVAEAYTEVAQVYERFIIGDRATGVQARIDEAYELAIKLLADDERGAPTGTQMRELVTLLSGLTAGPPF